MLDSRTLKFADRRRWSLCGILHLWRTQSIVLCVFFCLWGMSLGCKLPAQSHLFTLGSGKAGFSHPRPAGDVNGDGFDDVLVWSYWASSMSLSTEAVSVYSGRDGRVLWTLTQTSRYGVVRDLLGTGDLDRDGCADIAIVAFGPASKKKELWYISGKTGKLFRSVLLKGFADQLILARGGDVNADGYADLLIGDPKYGHSQSGRVAVISGKNGRLIHDLKPPSSSIMQLGGAVAAAGDTDEDGYADFLGLAWVRGTAGLVAYVYSGKTGQVLKTFPPDKQGVSVVDVQSLGDLNKDGRRDYALTHLKRRPNRLFLEIRSGAKKDKHKVLLTMKPFGGTVRMKVAMVGDINRDGFPDLAVGTSGGRGGWIDYRSGKDGKFLHLVRTRDESVSIGYKMGSLGDVNGDGMPDLYLATGAGPAAGAWFKLKVYVYSGAPMDLWSETHRVSLASQGKQVLRLDAGPKHAGSGYFVLSSLSGIKPGLKLGGLTLPLQPDAWFWLTTSYANSALLQGSLGVLDNKGQATCTLTAIPTLPTALIGARADHAYILFKNGRFTKTSHWVPLLFEK